MQVKRGKYVVIGTAMLLFLGVLYAWSFFKTAISAVFPMWDQKQLSLNFTIMMICFSLGSLLGGKLSAKVSRKGLAILAGVLLFIGFMVMSVLPVSNPAAARILMYVFYGGCTGLGVGIGYNAVLTGVNSWFPDKVGTISGILLTGFGLGSLFLGLFADKMMQSISLFATFRILGIACAAFVIIGALFIKTPAADTVLPEPGKKAEAGRDYTTAEMLKTPTFWFYFFWNLCMSATGMLVINNASSIAVFFGVAATIGLVVSVFNSCGRILIGGSMDRLGWKATMVLTNLIMIGAGVLMLLGNKLSLFPVILIGMLLVGICYGGGVTITASLIRTFYGSKNYPVNFSTLNLVTIPAAIIGPMISAALVDAAGGSYGSTFLMVIIMGAASMVLNLLVRKP